MSFEDDLKVGEEMEADIAKLLNKLPYLGDVVSVREYCPQDSKHYDLISKSDHTVSFEVKYDKISRETGNVGFEFMTDKGRNSGIFSTWAEHWVHVFWHDGELVKSSTPRKQLKHHILSEQGRVVLAGDGNAVMKIFPINEFLKWGGVIIL